MVAGGVNGIGTTARFGNLPGIASDGAGHLFVADYSLAVIRKVDSPQGHKGHKEGRENWDFSDPDPHVILLLSVSSALSL
jgi:hypothetical protein